MRELDENLAELRNRDPRPEIPAADLAAIRGAAREVWQQKYVGRRPVWMLPLAAALAGVFILAVWAARRPEPVSTAAPVPVAQVDLVRGTVTVSSATLQPGAEVLAGSLIESAPESRASLRLGSGASLRIDGETRALLTSPELIELQSGAVYVDSRSPEELVIRTAAGDFHPVGTQFEVRVDPDRTELRVREGRVVLNTAVGELTTPAGEALTIQSSGEIARAALRPDDPSWGWVTEAAPVMAIEGRTLRHFLDWISRERGWRLQFADARSARLSESIVVHGSLDQMSPEDALQTVLLSSGYTHKLRDGTLIVQSSN